MRFICSQDEDSRCHRLLRVLEFVHAVGSGLDIFEAVDAIEDHKGFLAVHWRGEPSEEYKTLFHVAWSCAGAEPYDNVSHVLVAPTDLEERWYPGKSNIPTVEKLSLDGSRRY